MTSTSTKTIYDLAAEFDRLSPSHVDTAISGNGQQEAGHVGHEARCSVRWHDDDDHDDDCRMATVGWFCDGGNVGNPVLRIHEDDVAAAVERLAAIPDGAVDGDGIGSLDEVLAGLRYSWAY